MNPSISVIIAVYNRLHLLGNVVDSILAQTIPVTEIIVIDDGSREHTPEAAERYIQERPAWRDRVRYIYQENQGQSVANNVGIAVAKGEWLGFDGSDDLWLPQKLEWQFKALERYKGECGVCFTDAWFMNNPHMKMTAFQLAGKQYGETIGIIRDPARLIANRFPVWMQTAIARADLVRQVGGLDPKLRYSEDHEFFFRLGLVTKFCFCSMPMVLIDRAPAGNRHTGETRNWHREEFCLQMDQYRFEKQLSLSEGLEPDIRKSIRRNLREIHSAWANWYLAQGEREKARAAISTAAKYELTPMIAVKWVLNRVAPELLRKAQVRREKNSKPRYDRTSWQTGATNGG